MQKIITIGLGHKARHGKDYMASYIQKKFPNNTHIVYWADSLKEEVTNKPRKHPLIERYLTSNNGYNFQILTGYSGKFPEFTHYTSNEVPYLNNILSDRKLDTYWGMDEKDSPILQFWGTDLRRQKFDQDYWVKKTLEKIKLIQVMNTNDLLIILIPDTRFLNEYNALKNLGGHYIKVMRYNEDGSLFADPSRDANHPSETELNDVSGDYNVRAKSGDVEELHAACDVILHKLGVV